MRDAPESDAPERSRSDGEPPEVARDIDATGLSCPMPVIELAKAIGEVDVGSLVRLAATDPAVQVDVPVWCRMQRQRLRSREHDGATWRFLVERVR